MQFSVFCCVRWRVSDIAAHQQLEMRCMLATYYTNPRTHTCTRTHYVSQSVQWILSDEFITFLFDSNDEWFLVVANERHLLSMLKPVIGFDDINHTKGNKFKISSCFLPPFLSRSFSLSVTFANQNKFHLYTCTCAHRHTAQTLHCGSRSMNTVKCILNMCIT